MKRIFRPLLLAASLVVLLLATACAGVVQPFVWITPFSHEGLTETEITLENEYLSFKLDTRTTMFTVTDKRTGKVWYSNPQDWEQDSVAIASARNRLRAQLLLTYGQVTSAITEIDNYTLSVANNAYSWERLDDGGLKLNYTLGRVERVFMIPGALPESQFMYYHDQMNDAQQNALLNYYRIIDINNLRATDNRADLIALYPAIEEERMFVLRENLQGALMERLEDAFESIGYTYEDFRRDQVYTSAGEQDETPVFNVSMVYRLDGPELVVSVPLDEIEYRSTFPVINIAVLPFFGAGGREDEGFMMVPDGSGAIIQFNNGKQNQTAFVTSLYGHDWGIKRDAILDDNYAYFPAFGVGHNDASFLCVIEDGAEDAAVNADVSGRFNSYNYVHSRFTIVKWDDVDISKARIYAKAIERRDLEGVVQQRYIFSEHTDYADMAAKYRNYLLNNYPSLSRTNENGLPAVLSVLGAINRTINVLGLPMVQAYPLTTYGEAADMLNGFADGGVNNLRVNMRGWFNGGVTHDTPYNINLIGNMGGRRGFTDLVNAAGQRGAELFVEADFTFIYDLSAFNGYQVNRDTARRISREVVELHPYHFVWFGEWEYAAGGRGTYYLANPAYTIRAIDRFQEQLQRLGAQNITFGAIGRSLNADYNTRGATSRREMAEIHREKLAAMRDGGASLMMYGGNLYAAVYADFVLNMPLSANGYNILDKSVPFYQMALHGLIPYTGSPINLAPDYRRAILETVETGAGLQFLFMSASGERLQETTYTRYYGADINRWGDEPTALYRELNSLLGHTVNQLMVGHQQLAHNVYQTVYEDGTTVFVNYGNTAYNHQGHVINGMDFLVVR